jgi:propionyl-CoA carboxylase alpha chain
VQSDWQFGQPLFRGTVNGNHVCIQVERRNMVYRLLHWGAQVDVMVLNPRAAELRACMPKKAPPDLSKHLRSPMPGLLAQLLVAPGDEVKAGQRLAVVEAMKMENVLLAERDGKVAKALAAVGDTLAVDQGILEFE